VRELREDIENEVRDMDMDNAARIEEMLSTTIQKLSVCEFYAWKIWTVLGSVPPIYCNLRMVLP
jgi:hypothetical protein